MECEDISLVLKKHYESTELIPLSATFYKDTRKYLRELEEEIEKCNNPRSKEYLMLSDELNNAIERIEKIFNIRRNKIFSMAAQASNLVNIKHKNYDRLLPEEKKMYDCLAQAGNTLKSELLDPAISLEDEPVEVEEENQDCILVRILKDVPTFTGADGRAYTVKAEEVISLPELNAKGLIKRNIAQIIEN